MVDFYKPRNNQRETAPDLGKLSPELREMFLKYSGPLIQLGVEIFNRDIERARLKAISLNKKS